MFGGDEVNAIVVDIGSCTTKAGYAGEDTPKCVFPSWAGKTLGISSEQSHDLQNTDAPLASPTDMPDAAKVTQQANATNCRDTGQAKPKYYVGTSALNYRRDDMEVVPALQHGFYSNWDVIEVLLEDAFRNRLRINPSDHPMMLAEPTQNDKSTREKMVEIMFELHSPPAIFLGRNAALSSFSMGRQTSLVMDCGYSATTVAAVHEGYVLQKSVCRAPLGGETLNQCMQSAVEHANNLEIRPRYSFTRKETFAGTWEVVALDFPKTTQSYKNYMKELISSDIKETMCRVQEAAFHEEQNKTIPTVTYELPDGQEVQIGSDRFKVPEILFQPTLVATFQGMHSLKTDAGTDVCSLPQMVLESINKCDVDIRKELCSGVLLTGGTSVLPQFRERMERELTDLVSNARVKVATSPSAVERRFSVWIGGSILASLGSFQQMWMSIADYEEHGASIIHRKSP